MKLVVAIDSDQSAKTALEHIWNAKYSPDTQVHLVHVIVPGFADAPVEGIPDVVAEEKAQEKALLNKLASALKEKCGITATSEILSGETAEVIAETCKRYNADEVIVPSHARHGFSRIWYGSVADEIVDEAPCAVLVLKMPQGKK